MKKRIDLILNAKGGVGKSFFAANLVQYLKDKKLPHVAIEPFSALADKIKGTGNSYGSRPFRHLRLFIVSPISLAQSKNILSSI